MSEVKPCPIPLTYFPDQKWGAGYIQFGRLVLAEMRSVDDFPCQEEHGADGGAIQEEINATGTKLVEAYNAHDALVLALAELVKLYGHYATLLNDFDGGKRVPFTSAQQWLDRLTEIERQRLERPLREMLEAFQAAGGIVESAKIIVKLSDEKVRLANECFLRYICDKFPESWPPLHDDA